MREVCDVTVEDSELVSSCRAVGLVAFERDGRAVDVQVVGRRSTEISPGVGGFVRIGGNGPVEGGTVPSRTGAFGLHQFEYSDRAVRVVLRVAYACVVGHHVQSCADAIADSSHYRCAFARLAVPVRHDSDYRSVGCGNGGLTMPFSMDGAAVRVDDGESVEAVFPVHG